MSQRRVIGLLITDRVRNAGGVQSLFTEYGCQIKTRIGLHEVDADHCSPNGLVILELFGDDAVCDEFVSRLQAVDGVEVQQMVFSLG